MNEDIRKIDERLSEIELALKSVAQERLSALAVATYEDCARIVEQSTSAEEALYRIRERARAFHFEESPTCIPRNSY